ncbi:response regulator [Rhizobium calliandrae]|uniref:Response regulator n=2 Tax=Rhizobium calliandrae TaxID=1312182 RepID=A0ABT7KGK4_9HYPH|nr:response regulator [Rhizobium calliandrae]MDL2407751.1 response regulator [Rhizobium calliandrae]
MISVSKGQPKPRPNEGKSAVAIVDDDGAIRESLAELLDSMGFRVSTFSNALEFLNADLDQNLVCIVLDVRLQGMSGLDLQDRLSQSGSWVPIVFMTGYADVSMSVQAMKGGAIDFLQKPFREQDILDAVARAEATHRRDREITRVSEGIRDRVYSLTAREREVLDGVCRGLMNKQIAAELGISEITVKVHRGHVMKKMMVRTAAELVKHASLHAFIDKQVSQLRVAGQINRQFSDHRDATRFHLDRAM